MTRPSAPRGYDNQTGAGRKTSKPPSVPDVSTLPCPATLDAETHELVNDARARTTCLWCSRPWAELDAEARAA